MIEAGKRYMVVRTKGRDISRFAARINWVEDRGDTYYIGYTPDDIRVCRWGCCSVKKNGKFKAINYSFERLI